jgi:hypothetical protein
MEAAGLIFGVLALLSSTIESTQYAIDRERRLFIQSITDHMVEGISRSSWRQNAGLCQLRDLAQSCERMLSFDTEELAQCRQLIRSKQFWARRPLGSDTGREATVRTLKGTCEKLVSCWQSDYGQKEPMFWRLQRWILVSVPKRISELWSLTLRKYPGKTGSHLLGIRIPEALRQPSPTTLLVSWLVITIVTIAYYEDHPRHRLRKAVLLGSAIVAIFIGTVEGSSVDTMLLTNVPWCVALGILLDLLVHACTSIGSRNTTSTDSITRGGKCGRKEQKVPI